MSVTVKKLVYKENGDPEKVIQLEESKLSTESLGDSEVLVRWLAAPINPIDLGLVQGTYGAKPAEVNAVVGGNEGCGEVEKVGSKVTTLKPGDWVIPESPPNGVNTWCTYGIYDADKLAPIQKSLSKLSAATIVINPPTAYLLLKDMVELKPGDVVAQNGANSACGRYIIQFCRLWGYKTVNVIRDRPGVQDLKEELKALGADEVYTEEEFSKSAPNLKGVRLAIDCVGGEKTKLLMSALEHEGTLVLYGGMANPTSTQLDPRIMIFKNLYVRGFWVTNWYAQKSKDREQVFTEIGKLLSEGKLKDPHFTERKIEDFVEAFRASSSASNSKQIFVF
ncbi:zinc-binding dehydrogenase domain-containing protein [Ditylenchus destructor]|uniref:Enoyl-[acyl-carrier-protein] reductase, mitochondrial n=1 Tax=Ditylenchus destructor TaxID=166010 RepID=A0AAD4MQE1_9BILA|nr:zinc-binding dehydrogenase domain-containing protein [Ditylenchus destructor]